MNTTREPRKPKGQIAHAYAAGIVPNRTLIRDAIFAICRNPSLPIYIRHNGLRLVIATSRPISGLWTQIGPFPTDIPISHLSAEIEHSAAHCRFLRSQSWESQHAKR